MHNFVRLVLRVLALLFTDRAHAFWGWNDREAPPYEPFSLTTKTGIAGPFPRRVRRSGGRRHVSHIELFVLLPTAQWVPGRTVRNSVPPVLGALPR
jgi:hypothetical protein